MTTIKEAIAVAIGVLLIMYCCYRKGHDIGLLECKSAQVVAVTKEKVEQDRRDAVSASANVSMLDWMLVQIPRTETKANETVERVRAIYRDKPVPVGCVRPDSVLAELSAARDRANAAASGL